MIKDMTEGRPGVTLCRFAVPMLLCVIFQQLYQLIDSAIAGRFISEGALAATGASYPVTMLFVAVAVGANSGCSVVISQCFGAKKIGEMKTAVFTSFLSGGVLSLLLMLLGLLCSVPVLSLLNTPHEIFRDTAVYLWIYLLGYPFVFFYNVSTGAFNALGDSKTPLFFLILSSVGNVVLDLWFVSGLGLGVPGLALATLTAQALSAVFSSLVLFLRLRRLKTDVPSRRFSKAMLFTITKIAVPSIMQQSFISVGNLLIQGLVNRFGATVIAGYSAAVKLNTFAITCLNTLSVSLSGFTAQNIGAKKPLRVKKGLHAGMVLALFVAVFFMVLLIPFGEGMVKLFLKEESREAIASGTVFVRTVSLFYPVILVKIMIDGVLRGIGDAKRFMVSTFLDLTLRVVLSYLLSVPLGFHGIRLSWPIGWCTATVLSCILYRQGFHKHMHLYD